MNLSAPFIRRPVMTTFVMLTILLAGWFAFFRLPVSDLPNIEHPHIQVSAHYLGANSETVLNLITIPLEKQLIHVKGVQEMTSTSSQGYSGISLSFDLDKDMDEAAREVQEALNRAESGLPQDMKERPTYSLKEGSQEPIMYLILTSDHSTIGELRSYVDAYVTPRLSRLEGVAQVMAFGAEKSIWLRMNPELMAARHVGFNQVVDTIKQHTQEMPLGSIQTTSKRLSIQLPSTTTEAKSLGDLKIGTSSVRIKDIAEISDKNEQEREFHFVTQEKTSLSLILGIQKISEGNTVAISNSVKAVLATLQKELPPSIHLNLWFDKAVWIKESLVDVQWTLVFAFILVVLVIYLSLGRLSESVITSVALPLSLVGTFVVMYPAHFSLDLLSLLALTLSVGFVVDDAIVVLENIVRCQEKGESPREASFKGSKQICFTVLSMTLSLVAVFIPLLFMPGVNGRLFREFSVTLAVAILVSGFVSLTLTPMLCSRFLRVHTEQNRLQKAITDANARMVGLYGRTLKLCFLFPKTIALTAIACVGITALLFSKLPVNLIPAEDRGFLFTIVKLPTGIAPLEVNKRQAALEELVKASPHVENFLSINWEKSLVFVVRLRSMDERPPQKIVIAELQKTFDAIPGIQTFIKGYQLINLDMEFGSGGHYQFVVRGMEFGDVEEATQLLTQEMKSRSQFPFVENTLKNDSLMLAMGINEEEAHKLGISKQQIQGVLQHAYGQGQIGSIQKGVNKENIYMELLPEYQNQVDSPSKLYLTTPTGQHVPLKALVEWEEKLGAPTLVRRDQLPSATIRFSLADGVSPNKGLEQVNEIAASVLPSTVSGLLTGSAKAIASTINDTLFLLLAAAVVMYIVLGILYESFIHPLTILSSIPFAGLGGILTLFLFDEPISIFSAVGFLLLIGIVKKNGIMMVDYAVEAQKEGASAEQAIFDACLVRFRPIMMTTIAAIMGAIPIAVGFGDGAEMRRGLGLVIVGGLLFSQLLTLYVTPVLFLIFHKLFARKVGFEHSGSAAN